MLGNTPPRETVLQLEARKSFSLGLFFKTKDNRPQLEAVDLTGATLTFVMAQPTQLGGAILINRTATISDPDNGYAHLDLQAADLDLTEEEYPCILTLLTAEGYSFPVFKGYVEIADNPSDVLSNTYTGVNPAQSLTVELQSNNVAVVYLNAVAASDLQIGTVTTVDNEIDASAQIIGRYPLQTLNLSIPRGEQGPTGPTGPEGPTGPQGEHGNRSYVQPTAPVSGIVIGDWWIDTSSDPQVKILDDTFTWVPYIDPTAIQAVADAAAAQSSADTAQAAADAAQAAADAAQVAADAAQAAADAAQGTADSKILSYVQAAAPTASEVGDIWYDSDDNNKPYRWNGTTWVAVRDGTIATAQATADSKVLTYIQAAAPTASEVGDIWFDSDDANQPYRWNGSSWVSVRDGTIAAGSGNHVYYQTTAPTGGTYVDGDIWFDTDDGFKLYVRQSGAWTASAFGSSALATDSVGSAQIAADAVGSSEIATDAVGSAEIAANAVGTTEIADDAVTAAKIATDAVTAAKIATDAVGSAEIAANAVGTTEIADDAVTAAKIAADAVGNTEIATDAVDSAEIKNAAVTAAKLAADIVLASTIRSSNSGAQVSFTSAGIKGIHTDGTTVKTLIDDATGLLSATGPTFTSPSFAGTIDWSGTTVTAPQIDVFSSATTANWTKPAGAVRVRVQVVGGGGAGGGIGSTTSSEFCAAAGGGGGGYSEKWFAASALGSTETYTVGAGGTGVAAGAGNTGGTSSFGTGPLLSATGGTGGGTASGVTAAGASSNSGSGGTGSGGQINITGGRGAVGTAYSSGLLVPGGGGGNPIGQPNGTFRTSASASGIAATTPGVGGQGASASNSNGTNRLGGAGGDGIVIVTTYFS